MDTITRPTLTEEVQAVADLHQGWDLRVSECGWIWGEGPAEPGTARPQLHERTPVLMHHAIALRDHQATA